MHILILVTVLEDLGLLCFRERERDLLFVLNTTFMENTNPLNTNWKGVHVTTLPVTFIIYSKDSIRHLAIVENS